MRSLDENGYFLLEIVLLGAILLSAISAFMAAASAQRLCERSGDETAAVFLAQEILSDAVVELGKQQFMERPSMQRNVMRSGRDFQVEGSFRAAAESARLCKVVLHISWQKNGIARKLSFQRLVLCHE